MPSSIPIPPETLALLSEPVAEPSNIEQPAEEVPLEAAQEEAPETTEAEAKAEEKAEAKEEVPEEKEEKPEEKSEEENPSAWNKRFSALARKEREVLKIQKETTELKKQLEAQRGQFEEAVKYKEVFNNAVGMFKRDPRAFIKDLCEFTGMNENTFYSNYTKQVLHDGQQAPDLMFNSLKEEISSLKQELLNKEKSSLEAMQTEKLTRFKDNIKDHVFRNDYPLIKQYNAIDEVFEFIEQDFRAKGSDPSKALTIEEACREFERALNYYKQVDEDRTVTKSNATKPKKAMSTTLSNKNAPEAMSTPAEETFEQRKKRIARETGLGT